MWEFGIEIIVKKGNLRREGFIKKRITNHRV
jgi:hypothetical protein